MTDAAIELASRLLEDLGRARAQLGIDRHNHRLALGKALKDLAQALEAGGQLWAWGETMAAGPAEKLDAGDAAGLAAQPAATLSAAALAGPRGEGEQQTSGTEFPGYSDGSAPRNLTTSEAAPGRQPEEPGSSTPAASGVEDYVPAGSGDAAEGNEAETEPVGSACHLCRGEGVSGFCNMQTGALLECHACHGTGRAAADALLKTCPI